MEAITKTTVKTSMINAAFVSAANRIRFSRISRAESEKWGAMMEAYLEHRENLLKVVQLVDIRHKPSAQDVQMYDKNVCSVFCKRIIMPEHMFVNDYSNRCLEKYCISKCSMLYSE